jgi:hypothetical protein
VKVIGWAASIVLIQGFGMPPGFEEVSVHLWLHDACVVGILRSEVVVRGSFGGQSDVQAAQAVASPVSSHRHRRQLTVTLSHHCVSGWQLLAVARLHLLVCQSVAVDDTLQTGLGAVLLTEVPELSAPVLILIAAHTAVSLPQRHDPSWCIMVQHLSLLLLIPGELLHLLLHKQLLLHLLTL